MISLELMPPLMFGGLILAMLIGFPVAFTLAAVGFLFGFLSIYLGFFDFAFLQAIPGRIFGSRKVLTPCARPIPTAITSQVTVRVVTVLRTDHRTLPSMRPPTNIALIQPIAVPRTRVGKLSAW